MVAFCFCAHLLLLYILLHVLNSEKDTVSDFNAEMGLAEQQEKVKRVLRASPPEGVVFCDGCVGVATVDWRLTIDLFMGGWCSV